MFTDGRPDRRNLQSPTMPRPRRSHRLDQAPARPGPAAAIYKTGPTGYGLAKTLLSNDIRTLVAAPSKLQRPSGSRVKTDAIDAEHPSTLLRLDAFTAVTVLDEFTEAARDLARAREDCCSDLMRARHRLSKPLLGHGIIYSGSGLGRRPRRVAETAALLIRHRSRPRAMRPTTALSRSRPAVIVSMNASPS